MANFIATFITKRVGSAIGGRAFGPGISSCDGMDRRGACCYDRKEAQKKNMNHCNNGNFSLGNRIGSVNNNKLGGVSTCQNINLTGELKIIPNMIMDVKNSCVKMLSGNQPFVREFPQFNLEYFYTALALTLNGHNLQLTVSLDPIDRYNMKCRLMPEIFIKERPVGNLLYVCDWILKCLGFGCFIDDQTGKEIPFDSETVKKLNAIGYKSIIQRKKEKGIINKGEATGATWIEPEYINIDIVDNKIVPSIGLRCFSQSDSTTDSSVKDFADWMTDNLDAVTKIFPIYNELRELIVCLAVVKVLRFYELDLFQLETPAIKHLQMDKFINHKFPDTIYKYHIFETSPNMFLSGGIVNNFSIGSVNKKFVNIQLASDQNKIKIDPIFTKVILTVLSELRFKLGFNISISISDKSTVKDLIMKLTFITKFDPNWIELYDDKNVLSNPEQVISNDKFIFKLNIKDNPQNQNRVKMCNGMLII
jgi:hypothetical protein